MSQDKSNGQERVDLLVVGAAEVATAMGQEALGGARLAGCHVGKGWAVAVAGERIAGVGPEAELRARFQADAELDACGGTVVPGFVDSHTHPVFAGTREDEFEMRTGGATYVEIGLAGGGILSTVRGVREESTEVLLAQLLMRMDRFLELGTTTVEAKSGYGLSTEMEIKMLRVIAEANRMHPVDLVPTFLGAHEYPEEYRDRRSDYVDLLVKEMLPRVAEEKLAEYCDIFTETHVFGLEDSRRILTTAKDLGFRLRLHVDQLTPLGGAELAAEFGADSADHLECVTDKGIEALGDAGVIPVICPLVALYLRQEQEVPGRRMIDAGLAPAIATDFNPGSCYTQSMPEVMTWSALRMRMSASEVLTAATLNAAASLNRADDIGTLEVGKRADLLVLDLPNYKHLAYELGRSPVRVVVKNGQVQFQK
ncbi:MAG: imidazolonepropionase [Planctomycetota bacterium]|nr:imidazolonepropionase [Planctomycetota bacterium]MDG2142100.1 imidazolonepropionase [Planctomycetota bacterium]